jgi:hypothetical protein
MGLKTRLEKFDFRTECKSHTLKLEVTDGWTYNNLWVC